MAALIKEGLLVSIGVCAYNEGKNIGRLLKSISEQKTKRVDIGEIIVVSDESTDNTDEIVTDLMRNNSKIRLIKSGIRYGKYFAVNKFLESAKHPVVVLASADLILDSHAIENLCLPFLVKSDVGIVACRPLPLDSTKTFFGFLTNLQWHLHHKISSAQPKFGEMIAFRKVIQKIPPTAVDEEHIAYLIRKYGLKAAYAPEAIVYNKGPDNMADLLAQRRRIFFGHLNLRKRYNYKVATFSGMHILKLLIKDCDVEYKKNKLWLAGSIMLECVVRVFAVMDSLFKREHYKWKIAQSTKDLAC